MFRKEKNQGYFHQSIESSHNKKSCRRPAKSFTRKIIVFPYTYLCDTQVHYGSYKISQGSMQNVLSEMGLCGKLAINKNMTDTEIAHEIQCLFQI